jgi:acyl-CoA thioesterase
MDTVFDRDTAVTQLSDRVYAATIAPGWRAGRGPHGGYLAAILLRALTVAVGDPERTGGRAPRSLTIHYASSPEPGPVEIRTTVERAGRSLSTLSARLEQDGRTMALALAAFSAPWSAPEIAELEMPAVAPPDPERESGKFLFKAAPPFTQHLVLQPRIGVVPFQGASEPMEVGAWIGLAEPRPVDALALAFLSDAMFSPPFIRMDRPATSPTIDLTIHFRTALASAGSAGGRDPDELCFARFSSGLVHEGFFEEDGVIWAPDGAVLSQSRQLGIIMPTDRPVPHPAALASDEDTTTTRQERT